MGYLLRLLIPVAMHSPQPRVVRPNGHYKLSAILWCLNIIKYVVLFQTTAGQPWPDSQGYWQLAKEVAKGDVWLWNSPIGYRTPGYSWLLAVSALISPTSAIGLTRLLQHGLSLVTDAIIVRWTEEVSGSRRAATAALIACIFSTARPMYANWVLTEIPATALLAISGWFLWRYALEIRPRFLWMASLSCASGILIRPSLIVLVPALIAIACWPLGGRQDRPRIQWGHRLGPVLLAVLLLFPWIARNGQLLGQWTLVTFTGRELWTTTFSPWPGAGLNVSEDGSGAELRMRLANEEVDLRHNWSVSKGLARTGLSDAKIDQLMQQVSIQSIRQTPGKAAFCAVARIGTFWYCHEYDPPVPAAMSPEALSASPAIQPKWLGWTFERTFVGTWTLSAATWLAIGVLWWPPSTRAAALILGYLLLSTTVLTAVLEIPMYRYRLPLEPIMLTAIFSALGVADVRKAQHQGLVANRSPAPEWWSFDYSRP